MAKKFLEDVDLRGGLLAAGAAGTSGQVLTSGGTGTTPSWVTPTGGSGSGTVTSITAGTGLTGGTITTSGTVAIDSTVVPNLGTANSFTGDQTINGNIIVSIDAKIGNGAATQTQVATNPIVVAMDTGSTYVQTAMINSSSTGSADFAAYGNNGTDAAGWVDMGFTGSAFNDPAYTLTGINEGYVLVQGVSGSGTGNLSLATGSNGSANDIVLATGGFATANEKARLLNSTGQLRVKGLLAQAGTATLAPLVLTSGTNLTAAAAGAIEYDGISFYATPTATTGRTVVDTFGYYAVGATARSLTSATGAQSAFGVGYTVQAATTYQFEIVLNLTMGTTTTRTTAFNFGGTATFTSGFMTTLTVVNTTGASTAPTMAFSTTPATALVMNASSTTAGLATRITGVLRVNAGGTIIPQVTFSAAPGGTNTVNTNSFMFIRPIGTSTATSVGAWA